jgi:hypothetical protein
MNTWFKAAVFSVVATSIGISAQAQNVVYDSSTATTSPTWLPSNGNEYGDQIKLSGTGSLDNTIGQFKLEYYLNKSISYNETVTINIYANDGTGGAPGSLLWSSGEVHLTSADGNVDSMTGYQKLTIDAPTTTDGAALTVPDWFTYTVSFGGIDSAAGEAAGLIIASAPTVGDNYSDYWEKEADGWHTKVVDGTPVVFGAQVVSVPEPSVIQLGMLGALGMLSTLALRRRSSK